MIAAEEQKRPGDGAGDFGHRPHEFLVRLGTANFCRRIGHHLELVGRLAVVEVQRTGRHVEARVLFQKCLLLRRPLLRVGIARRACFLANLFRQFGEFLFKRCLNKLVLFRRSIGVDLFRFNFNLGRAFFVGFRVEADAAACRSPPGFPVVSRLKDRPQLVIVGRRNRVVPMVVALSTADRQSQQRRADNVDRPRHDFVFRQLDIVRPAAGSVRSHPQKTRRDESINVLSRQLGVRRLEQLIAGKLLAHKRVVRHVLVERADDPVAVLPRPRPLGVEIRVAL